MENKNAGAEVECVRARACAGWALRNRAGCRMVRVVVPVVANADPAKVSAPGQFMRGLVFAQVTLGGGHAAVRSRKQLAQLGASATHIVVDKQFNIPITAEIELSKAPATLSEMIDAHTTGKIVVKM